MDRTNLRIQFVHRHIRDTLVILEEGNHPHPRCLNCDVFVPWAALNRRHPTTVLCIWGADWKNRILIEEEAREWSERTCTAYGCPLAMVTSFRYLGRYIYTSFFFFGSGLRDPIACSLLGFQSQNSGDGVTRLCPFYY